MRRRNPLLWVWALVMVAPWAALPLYPAILRADEARFQETDCSPPSPEFGGYWIRMESPDGTKKTLVFGDNGPGTLFFESTSLRYLKWAADLTDFEAITYRNTGPNAGMLTAIVTKRDPAALEFGVVTKPCWDGLRLYVEGLVATREIDGPGK